jgi:hypothetical protein
MEDCRPLDYIEWGWLPQIRDFLHHINGHIIIGERRPERYRKHDTYLMDSPYLNNITTRERIYIHRCRIYLQVATMSDIATADGTQIHTAWKNPALTKPSWSTLKWPKQNQPNRQAWNAWEKFLRSFETTNGKLSKPLGKWTNINKHREYHTYISNNRDILWIRNEDGYEGFPQRTTYRRAIAFHSTATTASIGKPNLSTPADILTTSKDEFRVSKPAKTQYSRNTPTQHPWYTRAPRQFSHITGNVKLVQNEAEIGENFRTRSTILAASDGGHDPTSGISTFGWTVAINGTIIARGKGMAQAHPRLAKSFRAEGYGLMSVAIFLQNIVRRFGVDPNEHTWRIFTDSKSLIQRIDSFHNQISIPRWNLRPDEDIAKAAYTILSKIPAQLIHIKSHQDRTKSIEKLTFEAQLNVIADEEATRQRNRAHQPEADVRNIGVAQLRINNIAITSDSQRWLLQTAGRIPIQQYYQEKQGWTQEVFETISWTTQAAVHYAMS